MSALDDLLMKRYRELVPDAPQRAQTKQPNVELEDDDESSAIDSDESELAENDADSELEQPSVVAVPTESVAETAVTEEELPSNTERPQPVIENEAQCASEVTTCELENECESDDADKDCKAEGPTVNDRSEQEPDSSRAEPNTVSAPSLESEVEQTVSDAESSLPVSAANFKAEWEVDRFLWPSICETVEDRLENELSATVQSIHRNCLDHQSNVVALTSVSGGAGSTTMILCIAREAARQGLTVAMVDLNHKNPNLMEQLGVACDQGIESLQKGDVDIENICVKAVDDGVSLFPTTEAIDVEYCAGELVQALIGEVSQCHDLVLVDTTSEVVDRISDRGLGFGMILVENPSVSQASDTQTNAEKIAGGDVRFLGVIKNFAA